MSDIVVVGIGLATLDVLLRLDDVPGEGKVPRVEDFKLEGGGMVGTAMVAVSRLGVRSGFIGVAGTDDAGELKLKSLSENGVDISRVLRVPGPEANVIIVWVCARTGERRFSGVRRGQRREIRPEELDKDYILSADYLHLDGVNYDAAMQAARWMRAAGKTVVYDGGKTDRRVGDHIRKLLENVDVVIGGAGFLNGLTDRNNVWDAGKATLDLGAQIAVQTDGENGSYTITKDDQFHTPAFKVDVIDTTGAGDVFHGAYIVGLHKGWNPREIALFATAVSAIKCTKLGGRAGIPSFDEVMQFLDDRGIRLS